jgi:internalin A
MRLLFAVIGLLGFSLSATAAGEWLYYKHYPWVYDNVSNDWLYLRGAADGSIYAYRSSSKEWEVFTASEPILLTSSGQVVVDKFDNQYRYRDLAGISIWTVYETSTGWHIQTGYHDDEGNFYSATGAFDQLPSSDFSQSEYKISVEGVYIWDPNGYTLYYEIESVVDGVVTSNYGHYGATPLNKSYFFISKVKAEEFYNLKISEPSTPIPTWDEQYEGWVQNPEPYGGVSVLRQIKENKDIGATELKLWGNNITDITPFAGLQHLAQLDLNFTTASDMTPISELTGLTNLTLSRSNISDIEFIKDLTNLEYLNLEGNQLNDLSHLSGLSNLKELNLWENNMSEITPLAGLTNLTKLYLSRNNITNISSLAGLLKLKELGLHSNKISDLSAVKDFYNLEVLYIGNNDISDLNSLHKLTSLRELWAWNLSVSDLSPLSKLTNLTDLRLGSFPHFGLPHYFRQPTRISNFDLSHLKTLSNLKLLSLNHQNIFNLSAIDSLSNLEILDLDSTNISDLTPLAGLPRTRSFLIT